MSLTQTQIKGTVVLNSDAGANLTIGNATATNAITGTTNINTSGGANTTIGTTNSGTSTVRGAIVNIGDTTGQVNIGLTTVSTGATPKLANITANNDEANTSKGCSLRIGNNNGQVGSPYKLYLAGADIAHFISSSGSFSNETVFGEYGDWKFYSTNTTSNRASISNATGVYTALSDINQKKDFEPSTLGLNEILQLKPTLYRFKNKSEKHEEQDNGELKCVGLIAQEVEPILPHAYVQSGDFIGLDYNSITAVLVKAVQELKADYEEKLSKLEARLLALETKPVF